jgi:TP901 family phage tail tape measure protein
MADIGTLTVTLAVDDKGLMAARISLMNLNKSVQGTSKKAADLATRMQTMGRRMMNFYSFGYRATMMLTVPLILAGRAAFKLAKDFDAAMNKIVGLVGIAREEMEKWKGEILTMAPVVGRSPKELADALYFVTSAGFKSSEALKIVQQSAMAAAAGLGETSDIAQVVTSAMNAYRKEGLTAARSVDILVAAVREGKAEAPGFASAIGQVIPIAAELGVSFDQVAGAMASMTLTGSSAANAAVYLKGILNVLIDPATETETLLRKMGTSANHLRNTLKGQGLMATLQEIRVLTEKWGTSIAGRVFPNIRALIGYLSLTGENLEYNMGVMARVKNSYGDAAVAFKEAGQSIQQRWNVAVAKGQVATITLGKAISNTLLPMFEWLMKLVARVGKSFDNLSESSKRLIVVFGGILAVLGPLNLAFAFLVGNILPGIIRGFDKISIGIKRVKNLFAGMTLAKLGVWGLIAAAIVGIGIALSKSKNRLNDFQVAEKKVNGTLLEEAVALNYIFNRAKQTTQGTIERKNAIQDINSRYGEYLPNLLKEKSSLEDIASAQEKVSRYMSGKIRMEGYIEALQGKYKESAEVFTKQMGDFASVIQKTYKAEGLSDFIQELYDRLDTVVEQGGGTLNKNSKLLAHESVDIWNKWVKGIYEATGDITYSWDAFYKSLKKVGMVRAEASPIIALMNAEIEAARKRTEELEKIKAAQADAEYEDPILQKWRLDIPTELKEIAEKVKYQGGYYDDVSERIQLWVGHLEEANIRIAQIKDSTDYLDKRALVEINNRAKEFAANILDVKTEAFVRQVKFIDEQAKLMGNAFEYSAAKLALVVEYLDEFKKGLNTTGGAINYLGMTGKFLYAYLQVLEEFFKQFTLEKIVEETEKASVEWINMQKVSGNLTYSLEELNVRISGQKKYLAQLSIFYALGAVSMAKYREEAEKLYQLESTQNLTTAQQSLQTIKDMATAIGPLTDGMEEYSAVLSVVKQRLEFLSVNRKTETEEFKQLTAQYRALLIGEQVANRVSEAMGNMFDVITDGTLTAQERMKAMGEVIHKAIISLLRDILVAITKALILKAVMSAVFPEYGATMGGGGIGGIIGAIFGGKMPVAPEFAKGGVVPPGYPNDTYQARLTSGETILPKGFNMGQLSRQTIEFEPVEIVIKDNTLTGFLRKATKKNSIY